MRTRRGRRRVRFEHEMELDGEVIETYTVDAEVEFGYPPPRHNGPDDPRFSDPGAGDEIARMTVYDGDGDRTDMVPNHIMDEINEAAIELAYEEEGDEQGSIR